VAGDGYGSTVPVVVIDEMDWFSKGQEPQVGAIKNIFACANSYDARKLSRRIAASTVEWDSGSTALAMLQESTDGRLHFKCPECDRYQRLAWSRVVFEGVEDVEVRDTARYVCEHCETKLDDEARRLALRSWKYLHRGQTVDEKGNIVGPRSRSESWGLLWTGLESTLLDMGTLAVEYSRAQRAKFNGDHEPARKFSRMRYYLGISTAGTLLTRLRAPLSVWPASTSSRIASIRCCQLTRWTAQPGTLPGATNTRALIKCRGTRRKLRRPWRLRGSGSRK
jgi:hypothetical protein